MNIYFDHVLGKQQKEDFMHTLVSATFSESEWDYAFQNGWAPTNLWFESDFARSYPIIWYQSRQTRIVLEDYAPSRKTKKLANNPDIDIIVSNSLLCPEDEVYEIYVKYCKHKNFGDMLDKEDVVKYFSDIFSSLLIHFYHKGKLVAITKISIWATSAFAEFFWWDYEQPDLSLGKLSFYYEAEEIKKLGFKFLYMGLGYNSDSIYKSCKKGFQFWNGRYWSDDSSLFSTLCEKDDSVSCLDSLIDYQEEYLRIANI